MWLKVNGSYESPPEDMIVELAMVDDSPKGIVDGFYAEPTGGAVIQQAIYAKGSWHLGPIFFGVPKMEGSYRIQATVAGITTAVSDPITVSNTPEIKFSRADVKVGKGLRSRVSVERVAGGAPLYGVDAVTVNLACSSNQVCAVPASVTIPAGGSYGWFDVEGIDVGSAAIEASADGYVAPQNMPVEVTAPLLSLGGMTSLKVGAQANLTVRIGVNDGWALGAVVDPIVVNLSSSNPTYAAVPSSVTIPAGENYVYVNVKGLAAGTFTITASSDGLPSATSAPITVKP